MGQCAFFCFVLFCLIMNLQLLSLNYYLRAGCRIKFDTAIAGDEGSSSRMGAFDDTVSSQTFQGRCQCASHSSSIKTLDITLY